MILVPSASRMFGRLGVVYSTFGHRRRERLMLSSFVNDISALFHFLLFQLQLLADIPASPPDRVLDLAESAQHRVLDPGCQTSAGRSLLVVIDFLDTRDTSRIPAISRLFA